MTKKIKVLVVDDSPTTRARVCMALENAGFSVRSAENIWIAPMVSEFEPDVLLVDLNVGHQNGAVAVKAMKRRKRFSSIPMYLYSSTDESELSQCAKTCGADGYIVKSSDMREMIQKLSSAAQKSDAVQYETA